MSAITGKTYSLYGNSDTTDEYYQAIRKLIAQFLQKCGDEKRLLLQIRNRVLQNRAKASSSFDSAQDEVSLK